MADECNCDCHNSDIAHAVACCFQCPYCGLDITVAGYDQHEKRCERLHIFDVEIEYFDEHRKELCQYHMGQFALIKGTIVHGFYDSHTGAYVAGINIFGVDTSFFIKEVQLEDEVICIPTIFQIEESEHLHGGVVAVYTHTEYGTLMVDIEISRLNSHES